MNRRYSLLPLVCGIAACADQPFTTGPTASIPSFEIADAASNYKAGFYWLAPMARQPSVSGTFDAALSPTVEICELVDNACGPVIANYTTTTGPGGEIVRLSVDDEHYQVNWQTGESGLSTTKLYRVSVRAGIYDVLLGYTDVQPLSNGSGLKNVDTDEYIGLKDGRTLPIKFRIETDLVGHVEVQPVPATAEPGTIQQFTAILRDLHANLMSADVTWASSDEVVATVDQTGLATAIADGSATITATSERVFGSATLTVVDYGACSPFQPIAWYPLDNHASDASGKGNDGTLLGTSPATNRNGISGAAVSLNGIDHSIALGERFNDLFLPVSVAAWVYQPASGRGDFRAIFITDDQPGRYFGISLQVVPSGLPSISFGNGGLPGPMSRRTLEGNDPVPTDSWVHIAATVRGATDMTLYVNGAPVAGTYTGTGGPLVHSPFFPARIGLITSNPENRPWLGELDDIRIYDCSLEAEGVAALLALP